MNFDLLYITYIVATPTQTQTHHAELPTAKYLPQGDQHVT